MPHSKKKKEEVAHVYEMCRKYFKKSPYVDILWSDKYGWLFVNYDPMRKEFVEPPIQISSGKWLVRRLIEEIANDVFIEIDSENGLDNANELELCEIRKRILPYRKKLPEYEKTFHKKLG